MRKMYRPPLVVFFLLLFVIVCQHVILFSYNNYWKIRYENEVKKNTKLLDKNFMYRDTIQKYHPESLKINLNE